MWYVVCGMWYVVGGMWYVVCGRWQVEGVWMGRRGSIVDVDVDREGKGGAAGFVDRVQGRIGLGKGGR